MKNEYINPSIEVIELNSDDVIATSTMGTDANDNMPTINTPDAWWND